MEKWTICNKTGDFEGIASRFGISRITARLLVNRGLKDEAEIEEFLNPRLENLHDPALMSGMDEAARIICEKISQNRRIRVIGDYDVDGIMATYILTDGLQRAGAEADWYIPHRIRDGYGVNCEMVENAARDGIDTIVTCDNGISAADAAALAKELGITMIVTDHHEAPPVLPEAVVIVDPKKPGDTYPCREICGAVVAAKLVERIIALQGGSPDREHYLEFMAMATVCDVVELKGENRVIAALGLERLRYTDNEGLAALIEATEISPDALTEYHMGFVLGPCFNATGRIDDAGLALELLMSRGEKAKSIAMRCRQLNEERKQMTSEQEAAAFAAIEDPKNGFDSDSVLLLMLDDCHESILGIIAGRIKERYNKPAIVFTHSNGRLKGSARSIPAYNMFSRLSECADLLSRFGGHPMAAGLSMEEAGFEELKRRLNENSGLTAEDMQRKLSLDAEVSFNLFDMQAIEEISRLAPFGQGNAAPLFAERGLKVRSIRYMGRDNSFLRFRFVNGYGFEFNATCFLDAGELVEELKNKYGGDTVDNAFAGRENDIELTCAYAPKINDYRDMRELQMNIRGVRI